MDFPTGLMDFIGVITFVMALAMAVAVSQILIVQSPLVEKLVALVVVLSIILIPYAIYLIGMSLILNSAMYRFYRNGAIIPIADRKDVRRHFSGVIAPLHRTFFRLRGVDSQNILDVVCPEEGNEKGDAVHNNRLP